MPRILAIEADSNRCRALTALVREHVKANLVVVCSVRAAIDSIAEHTPDLVIAPALLSPQDEAELLTHLKGLDTAPYIQMLTLPALDVLVDAPRAEARRPCLSGPVLDRRPVSLGVQRDRSMVAAQIVDGLARARELRLEYAARLACQEAASCAPRHSPLVPAWPANRVLAGASDAFIERQLRDRARDERRIALRKGLGDVTWLSGIRLPGGPELQLINISSSGVLIETGSKFAPGSTASLQLCGPETNLVVPVRFIRSAVARINGLGVRYRAAAAFTNEIDLAGPRRDAGQPATPSEALAALLNSVLSVASERPEPAHASFAQGLRQLVGARDVRVSTETAGSASGRGTLYFDVPGDDRSRATLQVTFDRNHDVTDNEFKLLKAAAWLTAAVLELEKPVSPANRPALLTERVA